MSGTPVPSASRRGRLRQLLRRAQRRRRALVAAVRNRGASAQQAAAGPGAPAPDDVRQVVAQELASFRTAQQRLLRNEYRQIEALLQLRGLVPLTEVAPPTRGWSASPDVLLTLVEIIRSRRPRLIVELGSGVSTLYAAAVLEGLGGDGRVVSLDHDAGFAAATRAVVERHRLAHRAEIRVAPISDLQLEGQRWPWYDMGALDGLDGIDLLFVDGPPGKLRPESRYPAVPVLRDRLSADAVVVVDDYNRRQERTMVARWVAADPRWRLEKLGHEKGTGVLRRRGDA
jgi:predicted O-methyltransferase YrrM